MAVDEITGFRQMMEKEAFHVWEYLEEAMQAQGYTFLTLAAAMGGNAEINLLSLYLISGRDERMILDKATADQLAKALGTSSEVWMKLDASYRRSAGLAN